MSVNNIARIGREQIETNATLREPIGIGAALAHLKLALEPKPLTPADLRAFAADLCGLKRSREVDESEPCSDGGRSSRDPAYEPMHDMEYLGTGGTTDFFKCRKCGKESQS